MGTYARDLGLTDHELKTCSGQWRCTDPQLETCARDLVGATDHELETWARDLGTTDHELETCTSQWRCTDHELETCARGLGAATDHELETWARDLGLTDHVSEMCTGTGIAPSYRSSCPKREDAPECTTYRPPYRCVKEMITLTV